MKRENTAPTICIWRRVGFFLVPAFGGEDIADNYQLEEMSLLCTGLKGETLQALRS